MARLTGPEYKKWTEAFKDAFDKPASLEFIVRVATGKGLEQVAIGANVEEMIEILIHEADRGGWLKKLLDAAVERLPGNALLDALSVDFAAAMIIEPDSPFDAHRIFGEAMFDREELRKGLRALQSDGAPPVLLVHGDPYTGKTWSARLIRHVADKLDGINFVLVDLEDLKGKAVNAATIGERIALESGLGQSPPPNEEMDAQWVRQYCQWLGRRAKETGSAQWVVIDHLQKVLLGQGAKDFLHGFGREIPFLMPMVRLIILSYHEPDDLAAGIGRIQRDPIQKMPMLEMRKWLATFFGAELLSQQRNALMVPDLAELRPRVAAATEEVMSHVQDDSPERLVQMGKALRDELARVQI